MVAVHATSGVFRTWFARELKLGELLFAEPTVVDDGACTIKLVTRPDLAAWVPASVRKHVSNAQQIEFHDELTYERSDDSRILGSGEERSGSSRPSASNRLKLTLKR